MIRLTYNQDQSGMLVSKEVVGNGNLLTVRIDPANLRFRVTNASGEHEFATGTASNLVMLKKYAKEALVAQGVAFTSEVRNRDTNEAPPTT